MSNHINVLFLVLAFVCWGCNPHRANVQLVGIESMQNDNPQAALDSLYSIDYSRLNDEDKHYYDFLIVKLSDKAYLQHQSDSLILNVLDYESTHKRFGRYPEALYYAGRVYSDLGDYPRAMIYFQQALDALEENSVISDLRARIASQYGRLLTNIGLYDEAIPLIKTSLDFGIKANDTINIINDLQLLAETNNKAGNLSKAEQLYRETYFLAKGKYNLQATISKMYLASIKYKLNENDSALFYANNIVEEADPLIRNYAHDIAANIYLEAGARDTAYKYAMVLVNSEDSISKEMGYNILLDPRQSDYIPVDTLISFINRYHKLLIARYNENSAILAINQQNAYNYQIHVREKESAERYNEILRTAIISLLLLLLLLGCIALLILNRNKRRIIRLQQTLANIKTLKSKIESSKSINLPKHDYEVNKDEKCCKESPIISQEYNPGKLPSEKELREKLQHELMQIYDESTDNVEIPHRILQSEAYIEFLETAHKGKMIPDTDQRWLDLEKMVLKSSPQFRNNLLLLTSGKLTIPEIHTALLIKCGFRPVDMSILLGKSNGGVITRRNSISKKVLGKKVPAKIINNIIRYL